MARTDLVRSCPTLFQERVEGTDIRVHVMGRRVFATEIVTDSTDYRFFRFDGSSCEFRPVTLDAEIEERCVRLTSALGLGFGGIDLRRTPQGEYYCFEVNPAPGFVFYQMRTGIDMGAALADLLCDGGGRVSEIPRAQEAPWKTAIVQT